MERTLVELSTDICVYGNYLLVDRDGAEGMEVEITSFDIEQGWFEADDGAGKERYFMKDYGVKPEMRDATWKPENNGKRMFLVKD